MNQDLLKRANAPFTGWQKGLVFEPKRHGSLEAASADVVGPIRQRQKELIDAVTNGPAELVQYLCNQLKIGDVREIQAPKFPCRELSPSEYMNPSLEVEEELGNAWNRELKDQATLASRPLFWLLCHIEWISEHKLGSKGQTLKDALMPGTGDMEGNVRSFLRRTGGLPHVRGNTSVFSDCPLARAWWRFRLASEVEGTTEGQIERKTAHEIFHRNRPSWETLIRLSLKRITAINQPRARAAIVHHLSERIETNGRFTKEDVETFATGLARVSLRRSLDHTPLEELFRMEFWHRRSELP
ncbi:MAG: hypothetical protein OXB95_05255 [Rhodobacteraceae bacterium]|nr:hypothetical protein [Paracoccaceae bacterium]